ncbi:MAG: hypothetical protein COB29_13300 [Sulfitobacter sp.]|nr:MAG: hypothetical protein COB29_13300 [Sulfitobacter sp.]
MDNPTLAPDVDYGLTPTEIIAGKALNELAKSNADLLEALEAITPKGDYSEGDWWCQSCQSSVFASFHENCSTCGANLTDCQPDYENILKAQAAIAKAKGEL